MNSFRSIIATIAGFAAIGFAALALLYGIFVAPAELNPTTWDWTLRILVIAAIVSFSAYLLAAPEAIGKTASKRSTRLSANAVVASVIAIVVVVFLNIIVDRFVSARADLTATKTFTLSDQTKQILSSLDSDVKILAFYDSTQSSAVPRQQIDDLLSAYKAQGGRVTTQLVDAYKDLPLTTAYLADSPGGVSFPTVVFDNGTKRETTKDITEAGFTTALVKLGQDSKPTVAFLTGHGERDSTSAEQEGYGVARQQLEKENYTVTTVNLLTATLSLSNTTVLVIAEPQRPLTANEIGQINRYLDEGGHVMILLGTFQPAEAFNSLKPIMDRYGVTAIQGAVVDQKSVPQLGPAAVLVSSYPSDSPITRPLQNQNLSTLFYLSAGLRPPTSTVGNMLVTSIIQSSFGESSFLETDIKPGAPPDQEIQFNPERDIPGPVTMGAQVAPQDTVTDTLKTRLVLYGDSNFPSNFLVQQVPGNLDLFANSVSWLAGEDELVSIRAKDPDVPRTITLDANQQRVVFFASVLGLPLLVMLFGAFIWWRRR